MDQYENTLFAQAERARLFWRTHFLDRYDIVLLLLPMEDCLTAALLAALEEKIRRLERVVGKPSRAMVLAAVPARESAHYSVMPVSSGEADDLLSLYCMYDFSDKLVIGSLDFPWGRKARNLLDGEVVSGTELIGSLFF